MSAGGEREAPEGAGGRGKGRKEAERNGERRNGTEKL